jgi:hypothetical protein
MTHSAKQVEAPIVTSYTTTDSRVLTGAAVIVEGLDNGSFDRLVRISDSDRHYELAEPRVEATL